MPALDISRCFRAADFEATDLVVAKGSRRVSVCLPARDEAATVGDIVSVVVRELGDGLGLVDEVLVVDDGSTDATAAEARMAGATVVGAADVLVGAGPGRGKGEALWKAVAAATGDLLVFCDADLRGFDARFVTGLLGPLLVADAGVQLVKGFYDRPLDGVAGAGGRVTELVARPLLALLFPHLAHVLQPLGGEFAARREVLEAMPFVPGYGVDLALLVDVAARFGPDAIAQVDLGTRVHRNRPLGELAASAEAVLRAALGRAGVAVRAPGPDGPDRPPLAEVSGYRRP
ncbi:MAG: glucosyl-3-phosphoglycerate synthase [Acidimicrobiales bacterium]